MQQAGRCGRRPFPGGGGRGKGYSRRGSGQLRPRSGPPPQDVVALVRLRGRVQLVAVAEEAPAEAGVLHKGFGVAAVLEGQAHALHRRIRAPETLAARSEQRRSHVKDSPPGAGLQAL